MQRTDLGGGRGWLDAPAAASIARIDAQLGHPLQITEAGRTPRRQQELRDLYLAGKGEYAATVEESPHPRGEAIDSDEAQRHLDLLAEHGWYRPLKSERWHFLYRASHDRHRNDPAPTGATASEEDDMRFHLFQIDPATDGRWVVVNYADGTYYTVTNGAQLDLIRKLPNVTELAGPQPVTFLAGIKERA